MAKNWVLLLSCEHGGHQIPSAYRPQLLASEHRDLKTHRGWDQGALVVARQLQEQLGCSLFAARTSRLFVDLNRSAHHPNCLGASYRKLSVAARDEIFAAYYHPYRQAVEAALRDLLQHRDTAVLHLAVHSFTPKLAGVVREADIGLLYDPARASEKRWADILQPAFRQELPALRTRRNYPYQGKSDGFTRHLRGTFPASRYAGFELEINQSLLGEVRTQMRLGRALVPIFKPFITSTDFIETVIFPS